MSAQLPTIPIASLERGPRRVLRFVARSRRPHIVRDHGTATLLMNVVMYRRMERELLHLREESRIARKVRRAETDIRAGRMRSGDLRRLLRSS